MQPADKTDKTAKTLLSALKPLQYFSALTTLRLVNEPRESMPTRQFLSSRFGLKTPTIFFGLNDPTSS